MKQPFRIRWRWGLIGLTLLVFWVLVGLMPAPASAQVESRLSQLEFQLRQVRSQVSQIEARLSQPSLARPAAPRPATPTGEIPADPSLGEQFDNLATLTIELRQQIRTLEERVTQLEQQRSR
ncbi:hypothetical protein [Pseudanabaena sp. FACHB-2040]|uniref:hypothetical protein n=1 Tax=Pseudanabaena sp. FACHB-2040 TaxID=2692859 RepID=UPI0016893F9F|nr:hypothetical protein [Pseudanabaena sp. FACHB-2040]MBD2260364.1 hypothetical protein [Pseudanabaena sp. FACHB-2040]